MTLTNEELERLLNLEEMATKAPWDCQIPAMTGDWPTGRIKPLKITGKIHCSPMLPIADAEFITAARNNFRALIHEVQRLRVELERMK